MMDSNTSSSQTIDTIRAMRTQQEKYFVSDYLSELLPATSSPTSTTAHCDTPVDANCRFLMATWCNQIADVCNYKRETIAIAMNSLDRFMMTTTGRDVLFDRNSYQLAVMTALYSSVKIHEQEVMDPSLIAKLSRGAHTPKAVEEMELKMLHALKWRVNQPTAMSFVRMLTELIEDRFSDDLEKEAVLDITRYQIEMIVNEYDFCHTYDSSYIASACMLNAIESATPDDGMLYAHFESIIANEVIINNNKAGNDDKDESVEKLRIAIYKLVNDNGNVVQIRTDPTTTPKISAGQSCNGYITTKDTNIHSSPTMVSSYNPTDSCSYNPANSVMVR